MLLDYLRWRDAGSSTGSFHVSKRNWAEVEEVTLGPADDKEEAKE